MRTVDYVVEATDPEDGASVVMNCETRDLAMKLAEQWKREGLRDVKIISPREA